MGLALTRKGGCVTPLTRQQAVDEALCCGRIDGQARKRDEAREAAGLMTDAGPARDGSPAASEAGGRADVVTGRP